MKIPITFYHGTTVENVKKLVQTNWDWTLKNQQTWLASMPNQVYAWCGPITSAIYGGELICSNKRVDNIDAIRQAFDNAQISAAIQDSRYKDLVVLGYIEEIEVKALPESSEDLNELINAELNWLPDYSSENMEGAFEISANELKGRMPDIFYIGVETYSPLLRGVLIPIENSLCNVPELTEMEREVVSIMRKNEHLGDFPTCLLDQSEWVETKNIIKYLKEVK